MIKKIKYSFLALLFMSLFNTAYAQCNQQDQRQAYQCMQQQLKTDKAKIIGSVDNSSMFATTCVF